MFFNGDHKVPDSREFRDEKVNLVEYVTLLEIKKQCQKKACETGIFGFYHYQKHNKQSILAIVIFLVTTLDEVLIVQQRQHVLLLLLIILHKPAHCLIQIVKHQIICFDLIS